MRDLEHANEYPEAIIEQMKELGVFGLAIPDAATATSQVSTAVLRPRHRGARPRVDEPGRRDGRPLRRGQAARRASAPRSSGRRYLPRMATGEVRATMALTEPGGGSDLQAMRTVARPRRRRLRRQRLEDVDHERPPCRADRAAVQDRPGRPTRRTAASASCSSRTVPGFTVSRDLPKLGYKGVESCELIFDDCRGAGRRAARRRARGAASRR